MRWLTPLGVFGLLVAAGGLAIIGSAFLARRQAVAWLQPPRLPGGDQPPAVPGLALESVALKTADGLELRAWFAPPAGGPLPAPAVILLHGLESNRDGMLDRAAILARHGFATLSLELRGHGRSGGAGTTLGIDEVEDVRAAVRMLAARGDVDRARLGILGHSLGGVVAIRAAFDMLELKAVVAESTFRGVADIAPAAIAGMSGRPAFPSVGAVLLMMDWTSGRKVSAVRTDTLVPQLHRPLMFVHGGRDPVVPPSHAREMAAMAQPPAELYIVEGAGHIGLVESDPAEYERRVTGFFTRSL